MNKMMNQLLRLLGRTWNKLPKDIPVITVSQGAGVHTMATVDSYQLVFHSESYRPTIPVKQAIVLDDMTFSELVDTAAGMGYSISLTQAAIDNGFEDRSAAALMEFKDIVIVTPYDMRTFTSKLWAMLYPLVRLLERNDSDVEAAINEMFATETSGTWLDYWASFMKIKRLAGENDDALSTRMFLTLLNLKTNNIAIQEMVNYTLRTTSKVTDTAPSEFEVQVGPEYMSLVDQTVAVIESLRAAGMWYVLHYLKNLSEDYPSYLTDKVGKSYRDSGHVDIVLSDFTEEKYGWIDSGTFSTNASTLNGSDVLVGSYRVNDDEYDIFFNMDYAEIYTRASEAQTSTASMTYNEKTWPFEDLMALAESTYPNTEEHFRYRDADAFTTNSSELNGDDGLVYQKTADSGSMQLYDNSGTIQSLVWG